MTSWQVSQPSVKMSPPIGPAAKAKVAHLLHFHWKPAAIAEELQKNWIGYGVSTVYRWEQGLQMYGTTGLLPQAHCGGRPRRVPAAAREALLGYQRRRPWSYQDEYSRTSLCSLFSFFFFFFLCRQYVLVDPIITSVRAMSRNRTIYTYYLRVKIYVATPCIMVLLLSFLNADLSVKLSRDLDGFRLQLRAPVLKYVAPIFAIPSE